MKRKLSIFVLSLISVMGVQKAVAWSTFEHGAIAYVAEQQHPQLQDILVCLYHKSISPLKYSMLLRDKVSVIRFGERHLPILNNHKPTLLILSRNNSYDNELMIAHLWEFYQI